MVTQHALSGITDIHASIALLNTNWCDVNVVGICQREVTEHFPGLEDEKDSLTEVLLEFFEEHLEHRFPDPDYTFDVYITSTKKVEAHALHAPQAGYLNPYSLDNDKV